MSDMLECSTISSCCGDYRWILVACIFASFITAFGIGANDVANAFATSVGAKSLTMKQAILVAAIFEFVGAAFLGGPTTDTVRKGITSNKEFVDNPEFLMIGMLCAEMATAIWLLTATYFSLPVSTTHSIIGAIIGFSLMAGGTDMVDWEKVQSVVISWFVSPILSGVFAASMYAATRRLVLQSDNKIERCLKAYAGLFAFTVALNVYYFMYKGASKMMPDWLQLDKDLGYYTAKQIGGSVGIAVAVGVVWALLIQFLPACFQITVPALRRKLENERKKGTFDNVDGDVEMKLSNGANGNGNGNGSSDTEELNNLKKENVELKAKLGLNPDGSKVSCLNKAKNLFDCSDIEKGTEKSDHVVGLKSNMTDYGKDTEYVFSFLQIFTACVDALGHGANDVANSIAPLTAVYTIYLDSSAVTDKKVDQVLWIIVLGGAGIVAGLALYGRNIIRALGVELVSLSPSRGFTIELGAAFVIVGGSMLGLPLSTTHCQVGAETAVGMLEGAVRGVNWKFMAAIFAGWVFTLVIAGCLSALFFGFATSSPSLGGLEGTRNLVLSGSSDLFANVSVPLTISSQIVTRNFEQTSVACTF